MDGGCSATAAGGRSVTIACRPAAVAVSLASAAAAEQCCSPLAASARCSAFYRLDRRPSSSKTQDGRPLVLRLLARVICRSAVLSCVLYRGRWPRDEEQFGHVIITARQRRRRTCRVTADTRRKQRELTSCERARETFDV